MDQKQVLGSQQWNRLNLLCRSQHFRREEVQRQSHEMYWERRGSDCRRNRERDRSHSGLYTGEAVRQEGKELESFPRRTARGLQPELQAVPDNQTEQPAILSWAFSQDNHNWLHCDLAWIGAATSLFGLVQETKDLGRQSELFAEGGYAEQEESLRTRQNSTAETDHFQNEPVRRHRASGDSELDQNQGQRSAEQNRRRGDQDAGNQREKTHLPASGRQRLYSVLQHTGDCSSELDVQHLSQAVPQTL